MTRFALGAVEIDLAASTATGPHGMAELRPLEARLLMVLARHTPKTVSREVLLTEVWGYSATSRTRTLGTTVARLRRKIAPGHLQTVHGEGFRLVGVRPLDLPDDPIVLELVRAARDGRRLLVITGPRAERERVAAAVVATLGAHRVLHELDATPALGPSLARRVRTDPAMIAVVTSDAPLGLHAETVVPLGARS